MKHFFATLITIMIACEYSFAQSTLQPCATFQVMQNLGQQEPDYLSRVTACFENAQQIARANKLNRAANDTIYRIQMVFHIVYIDSSQNIPDSVIYSQIDVLNEDYRRLNADTSNTREEFKPVAEDAHIEFYLATKDPNGLDTNGITRTASNASASGFLPGADIVPNADCVKRTASKGIDPWPTDRYLNVWVCKIRAIPPIIDTILGYSYPPSNAPGWHQGSACDSANEGVVLYYPVVGRNYYNPFPVAAGGRTLTHEIAHYLGVRHTWGDTLGCSYDDGLADTPFQYGPSEQNCDTSINSCVDSPIDFHDMVENFMDYSTDYCRNIFTKEQVGIMHAMLQTSRAGIATKVITTDIKIVQNSIELVQLFPNPSTGVVTLNVKTGKGANYNCEIFNSLGQRVAGEREINPEKIYNIDMTTQPNGVYFAKINCRGEVVVRMMVIGR